MTSSTSKPAALILGALGLAYPLVVYAALDRVPAGAFVFVAVGLAGARLGLVRGAAIARPLVPPLALVVLATAVLGLADAQVATLAYPVLMSLGMAVAFGLSLLRGPTLVELFARASEPDPGPAARAYMRKVTWAWLLFLLANGAVSAFTALWGEVALWALYNGLVSYGLMGLMFGGEFLIRRKVRA